MPDRVKAVTMNQIEATEYYLSTMVEIANWRGKIRVGNVVYQRTHPDYPFRSVQFMGTIGSFRIHTLAEVLCRTEDWMNQVFNVWSEDPQVSASATQSIENILESHLQGLYNSTFIQ